MTSLRRRLFLVTAAAVLASVAISLAIGGLLTRNAVKQQNINNLGRQADLLVDRAQVNGTAFLERPAAVRRRAPGLRLAFVPIARTRGLLPQDATTALQSGEGAQGDANGFIYAARPIDGRALVLLRPDRLRGRDWRPFLNAFLIAGLVGAALAAVVSFALARRISGPVLRVSRASQELAGGGSPAAVPVEGPEEIAALARSFNAMHAQLAASREGERSFLLSVSHELKTPLTAIRGYVEALSDGAVPVDEGGRVIDAEAARLERLVRDLLDLARLDQHAFEVRAEPIDLADAVREVERRYARQAEEFGIALEAETRAGAPARGDLDRVIQIVSNLVENALRVTPRGGRVTVAAQPGTVVVEDTGPGLDRDDLPRAFERFYLHRRLGDQRLVGSGLGLAIVKELSEAMGGGVTVSSAAGQGTQFVVRLPRG